MTTTLALAALALAADVDFAHDVLPVLKARCAACHAAGTYKGGVSFDTRADLLASRAAVPGKPAESELLRRVRSADPEERMPPKGPPLAAKEVAALERWVAAGLPWPDELVLGKKPYAAPLAPRRPALPPARPGRDHPIDRVIDADLARRGVALPPAVGDAAFARRAWLDLVGLLPPADQLAAFLADAAPDKRARLVRRLLGDRRAYAEHWLTFWNDLLRNDYEGTGYIDGGRKPISPWLYAALLDNKPYDRFVRELVSPTPESEGFARGIKWRGVVNASQVVELQFAQNVGQVFLGVNLKCASCHDSFIDRWKLADAYGLAAVAADGPLPMFRCDKPTGASAGPRFLFPGLGGIDPAKPRAERLARLADLITHPDNGRPARTVVNRLWHRLTGRGIVHPVDAMDSAPWSPDLLDHLATYLADNGWDLTKTLEHIATSQAYQEACLPAAGPDAGAFAYRGPMARRLTAEMFLDAVWRLTGTGPGRKPAVGGDRGGEPVRAALVPSDPLMRSLGRPNREQVVTTRPDDLGTLQALDLTNGPEFAALLARGAKALRDKHPSRTADGWVDAVFVGALSRPATAAEREAVRPADPVTEEGLADLLWAVLMLPEFQMVR